MSTPLQAVSPKRNYKVVSILNLEMELTSKWVQVTECVITKLWDFHLAFILRVQIARTNMPTSFFSLSSHEGILPSIICSPLCTVI